MSVTPVIKQVLPEDRGWPAASVGALPGGGRLTGWDAASMGAGFALTLLVTCLLSRGHIFWEDEVLGWRLLSDPSWHHMVQAWKLGADGGGFSFYVIGRAWFWIFGSSEISFRLFSGTCFGLAFIVLWVTARRYYTRIVTAFALFNTWFFCPPITYHMTEGRFYGLLILGTALAFSVALRLGERDDRIGGWWYLLAFAVNALLTTSHQLGVVYSAFLLLPVIVLDRLSGRRRLWLYFSWVLSWLLLVPERANIAASAQVGKPRFWVDPPTLHFIIAVYRCFSIEIGAVVLMLLCLVAVSWLRNPARVSGILRRAYRVRRPVYVTTLAFLLVPAGFLLEGALGTWLFTDRYLLPIAVAFVFVTAEGVEVLRELGLPSIFQRQRVRVWGTAAYTAFLLVWVFVLHRGIAPGPLDYTAELAAKIPAGMPVVFEDAFTFTEVTNPLHARPGVAYRFLLDWQQSMQPTAPRIEVTQYHLMENWKKAGYTPDTVQYAEDFLTRTPQFAVVHSEPFVSGAGNPWTVRLRQTPGYEVRPVAQMKQGKFKRVISVVCRGKCSSGTGF